MREVSHFIEKTALVNNIYGQLPTTEHMAKTCPSPYDVRVTSRDKGRQQHLVQDIVPVL